MRPLHGRGQNATPTIFNDHRPETIPLIGVNRSAFPGVPPEKRKQPIIRRSARAIGKRRMKGRRSNGAGRDSVIRS